MELALGAKIAKGPRTLDPPAASAAAFGVGAWGVFATSPRDAGGPTPCQGSPCPRFCTSWAMADFSPQRFFQYAAIAHVRRHADFCGCGRLRDWSGKLPDMVDRGRIG